jgi:hypothetical protein
MVASTVPDEGPLWSEPSRPLMCLQRSILARLFGRQTSRLMKRPEQAAPIAAILAWLGGRAGDLDDRAFCAPSEAEPILGQTSSAW